MCHPVLLSHGTVRYVQQFLSVATYMTRNPFKIPRHIVLVLVRHVRGVAEK